jgi:hypothetical protein
MFDIRTGSIFEEVPRSAGVEAQAARRSKAKRLSDLMRRLPMSIAQPFGRGSVAAAHRRTIAFE